MARLCLFLVAALLAITSEAAGAAQEVVHFKHGAWSATLSGNIRGYDIKDYRIGAKTGQAMSVLFTSKNRACYFNVLPPTSKDTAIFIGSTSGNEFTANLKQTGDYVVRVYLMRSAARRNEQCRYSFTVEISPEKLVKESMSADDALVPGTNFNATSQVPCSREAGQPSTSCRAGVVRYGESSADVTVFWPGGGKRVLFFKGGKFVGADISQADGETSSSSTIENGLYLIRVGAQRFEIPDALVFGG